jgi:hypothetical protein
MGDRYGAWRGAQCGISSTQIALCVLALYPGLLFVLHQHPSDHAHVTTTPAGGGSSSQPETLTVSHMHRAAAEPEARDAHQQAVQQQRHRKFYTEHALEPSRDEPLRLGERCRVRPSPDVSSLMEPRGNPHHRQSLRATHNTHPLPPWLPNRATNSSTLKRRPSLGAQVPSLMCSGAWSDGPAQAS